MTSPRIPAVFGARDVVLGDDVVFGADGEPVPQPHLDRVHYWIVDAWGFLEARHRARGRGRTSAWLLGLFGSMALDFTMRLGGRRPYGSLNYIKPVPTSAIDDSFDDLWNACRGQMSETLLTVRDAAALRVRLGDHADTRVLRYDRDGRLLGYVAVVRTDDARSGLSAFIVVDILIADADPAVTTALLAASYEYATAKGAHLLEISATPQPLMEHMQKHKPYVRALDQQPLSFSTADPALRSALSSAAAWYLTAIDLPFFNEISVLDS